METLEQQLSALKAELKPYFEKAAAEQKTYGTMLEETRTQMASIQKQMDAIDQKLVERTVATEDKTPGFKAAVDESESLKRLMRDRKGSAVIRLSGKALREFEGKTTITSAGVGAQTTGVLQIERIPGITPEARQELFLRDVLTARPTTMQVIDFVKVLSRMAPASPQTEGSAKAESEPTFQAVSQNVQTIAVWTAASKQVLDDMTELLAFLQGSLRYYVDMDEELQMLSGSGTGVNLNGLITQASAFNTGLLVPSGNGNNWNKIDIVGRAVQQLMGVAELKPTFIVMHPTDWWDMRLTKDGFGRYILGDPQTSLSVQSGLGANGPWISPMVQTALFDLRPVATTNIPLHTFLIGSGNPMAAEIRDRMELQIEISTEYQDYFVKNLVAIRGEKRLALITKRPGSYITGTFTTSP